MKRASLQARLQVRPSGRTAIGPSGPIIQTGAGPPDVETSRRRRRRRRIAKRCHAHAPLVGAGNLSESVGCVDPRKLAAGLGGFGAPSGHAVPRRQSAQGICGDRRVPGLRGRKRWFRRNQCRDFWSLKVVWGSAETYGNMARMGIRGAWRSARHGNSVWPARWSLRTLRIFVNLWEVAGVGGGAPGCMWIWKMRLSGCRRNVTVTSTLLSTSKNPVDFENSYSPHVQLEATSSVTAIFFEDSGFSYCRTTVAIN